MYGIEMVTKAPPPTPSLSIALNLSMGTSDVLEGIAVQLSGATQATPTTIEVMAAIPDTLPIDIRAKMCVAMINLSNPLPEVLITMQAYVVMATLGYALPSASECGRQWRPIAGYSRGLHGEG